MTNTNDDLGPFGRSFIGEFPTIGSIILLATSFFLSALLSLGNLLPFLILLIFSSSLVVYLSYNFIEPHFNSKSMLLQMTPSSKIKADSSNISFSDLGSIFQDYGKSMFSTVWNLSLDIDKKESEYRTIRKGKKIGNWSYESKFKTWIKISIIWVTNYISLYVAAFVPLLFIIAFDINSLELYLGLSLLIQWLLFVLIILIVLYFEDKFVYLRELFFIPNLKQSALLIVFVSILDFIIVIIYLFLYDLIAGSPSDTSLEDLASSTTAVIFLFLALVIAAPLFEEILFRGYFLDKIRNLYSDNFAIISTGILFGLMHWDPFYAFDFAQPGSAMFGGFLYAWLRIKTGSLWPSIICHALWNFFIFSLFLI